MVHDNLLDLTLLRSPSNPDPDADIGEHEFTYSLLPHKYDLIRSAVIIESTCPPGTTIKIKNKIAKSLKFNDQINIAYCPERILPGLSLIHI